MRARLLLLFAGVMAVRGQEDPKDLLVQVSRKVIETMNALPRYVCTQTVERAEYKLDNGMPGTRSCDEVTAKRNAGHLRRQLSASDRLRFDVAIGVSHEVFGISDEMYSWVGDRHFHDPGLLDLVRQGAISTGSFSSFLVSLFGGGRANFSYNGDHIVKGRLLSEFGFRVPLEKSNYVYRFGNKRTEVLTAYDGTFLVDPKTVDLVRLVVRQDLPPETGACEATHTVDYGHVRINEATFLLARAATLDILTRKIETENPSLIQDAKNSLANRL